MAGVIKPQTTPAKLTKGFQIDACNLAANQKSLFRQLMGEQNSD
jgi:hypothetical protein